MELQPQPIVSCRSDDNLPSPHVARESRSDPWEVIARRTKGGQANSKRWAVLFTCMATRAVHIEVIEAMSSSSFINALRRFLAIRGVAKQLRSDWSTNFVGASRELKLNPPKPEEMSVDNYLISQRCIWLFNPPHSSHMGGSWERMIGTAQRILDSMLLQASHSKLTHEVLVTLMAEVAAIINARPLVPVSSDPEAPLILTPSTLLTLPLETLPRPTCLNINGRGYKFSLTLSGFDGRSNTSACCRVVKSGSSAGQTSRKGTLFF